MQPATPPRRRELFDDWSASYDPVSDNAFPFGAYEGVLDRVAERVVERRPRRVLEVGVGTGNLTRRLIERLPRVSVVGIDFSPEMAKQAAGAFPGIELIEHDLTELPLPPETGGCDLAAMTYVLHEFPEDHQLRLVTALLDGLREGGACIVGDVCFPDAVACAEARSEFADRWDPEEHYLAADVFGARAGAAGLRVEAEQVGPHAGVLVVDAVPS
jgi:putative AdoMet-dependent methyltransferase